MGCIEWLKSCISIEYVLNVKIKDFIISSDPTAPYEYVNKKDNILV